MYQMTEWRREAADIGPCWAGRWYVGKDCELNGRHFGRKNFHHGNGEKIIKNKS